MAVRCEISGTAWSWLLPFGYVPVTRAGVRLCAGRRVARPGRCTLARVWCVFYRDIKSTYDEHCHSLLPKIYVTMVDRL